MYILYRVLGDDFVCKRPVSPLSFYPYDLLNGLSWYSFFEDLSPLFDDKSGIFGALFDSTDRLISYIRVSADTGESLTFEFDSMPDVIKAFDDALKEEEGLLREGN